MLTNSGSRKIGGREEFCLFLSNAPAFVLFSFFLLYGPPSPIMTAAYFLSLSLPLLRRQILSIFLSLFFFFAVSSPDFSYFLIFCLLPLFFSVIFSLALFFAYRRNFPPYPPLTFLLFSLSLSPVFLFFLSPYSQPFPSLLFRFLSPGSSFTLLPRCFRPPRLPAAPRPGSLLFLSFSLSPVSSSLSAFRPSFSHLYASFSSPFSHLPPTSLSFFPTAPALFRIFPLLFTLKTGFCKNFLHTDA